VLTLVNALKNYISSDSHNSELVVEFAAVWIGASLAFTRVVIIFSGRS